MGERVAHLVTGKMIDFIEFDDGFAIVKTRAPREAAGKTLGRVRPATQVRRDHRGGEAAEDRLHLCDGRRRWSRQGDLLIVSGATKLVEAFAAIT